MSLPRWLRHRRLSLRVVLVILLISSVFTLLITAYQLYSEYRRDVTGLESSLEQAEYTFAESLGRSVWALDEEQVLLQLQGILQLPHVHQIRVEGDLLLSVGDSRDYPYRIDHRFPIRHTGVDGRTHALGEVHVVADLEGIHAAVWDRALLILVAQGLKTFSVSVLILSAFYLMVTRHLQSLATFAKRLRLNRLNIQPRLERPARGWLRPDELDAVSHAFGHAVERIRRDVETREVVERERDLLARALEQSPAGVLIIKGDGVVEYANPRFLEFSACSPEQLIGQPAFEEGGCLRRRVSVPPEAGDPWQAMKDGGSWQGEIRFRREDGHYRWAWTSLKAVSDGGRPYFIALIEDTTQLRTVQERLDFHTHFDTLTELPNRVLAYEHLSREIGGSDDGHTTALVFLDIDNFKYINDSLGHEIGDRVLTAVANRLRRLCDPEWVLARFGSDEFLIVIPRAAEAVVLSRRLEGVLAELREPLALEGETFYLSATAGVALSSQVGGTARELLQAADTALYAAKKAHKNTLRFYQAELGRETQHRLTLESDLRQALALGQFALHYQPIIALDSGQVVGLEALIRWDHPERGLVSPEEFIALSEENGLIVPIGEWVLATALEDLATLRRMEGMAGLHMAVNISSRQLLEEDFMGMVERELRASGLPGSALQLELTERLFLEEYIHTRRLLADLASRGVNLVIDDFGTGYSALSYLRRLNVHALKVDREFVRDIDRDEDDALLTRAIVSLAHDLQIQVVAEGVEEKQQLDYLKALGCEMAQGYLLARPMPLADLRVYLESRDDHVQLG
ncbi:bifunctional diguanylate cyclase/phosphodiesterase [Natronospira bacteriovora]|uniref:EAL domain-containing protein n=1 Tax=Natronospira bacteriovora TaxID=3069753 RepID=A0ABU0W3X7_9GAMM|nr:EAL domain-containing protein [Natronospira sp. AB-CW4]MDQ2068726.1 EAL domain-containing protein [Natronospira sp. AB-CW4]